MECIEFQGSVTQGNLDQTRINPSPPPPRPAAGRGEQSKTSQGSPGTPLSRSTCQRECLLLTVSPAAKPTGLQFKLHRQNHLPPFDIAQLEFQMFWEHRRGAEDLHDHVRIVFESHDFAAFLVV
jgi:hypothetical protein